VIGTWAFSAHDYTDDELLYGALSMLKHALQMPELEKWRIPDGMYFLRAKAHYKLTGTRGSYCLPSCESHSVQRIRQVPQFPSRRRCPPSLVSLPRQDRDLITIPSQRHVHDVNPKVANS
jgi:hypothetical protein